MPSALPFCHRVPLGARPAAALPSTTPTRQRSPRMCGRLMCPGACCQAAAAMAPAVAATPVAVTAAAGPTWMRRSPSLQSTLTAPRWEDWQVARVACTQIPPCKHSRWLATRAQAVALRSEAGHQLPPCRRPCCRSQWHLQCGMWHTKCRRISGYWGLGTTHASGCPRPRCTRRRLLLPGPPSCWLSDWQAAVALSC